MTSSSSWGILLCLDHLNVLQGPELIEKASGLHGFMNWRRNLLTVGPLLCYGCGVRDDPGSEV